MRSCPKFRALLLCMGLLFAGDLRAETIHTDELDEVTHSSLLVANQQARRGLWVWTVGAGLKTLGGSMLWLRIQRPPSSLALQQGLKTSTGLFILVGVAMVHTGAIMEWTGIGRAVRLLEDAGRAPEVDRVSLGRWLYLGSIGLPPLRPGSVYLGYQQLEELEAASIRSPK
jgi:hypothetical protein